MSKRKPLIIVSVTNDLATDQRVRRFCGTLHAAGYEILLTGRMLPGSLPVDDRPYVTRRVKHWFVKGAMFYAEYNIRLFLFLLFTRHDFLHSNDLDTLPANYLASRLRKKPLVYDSHEYFTEVPELSNRKMVKRVWEKIEKLIFPRLEQVITVSNSIATTYNEKYGKNPVVIRNVPERTVINQSNTTPSAYGLPYGKKLIILQGTGINRDRGAEEAVSAMEFVDNSVLVIAGKGDVLPLLKNQVKENRLSDRVIFIPPLPYGELIRLTSICDAGLSVDKDTNLNYRYSLPNKLFDYITAGIPVVASPLPEIRKIVEKYDIGLIIKDHSPREIARAINSILFEKPRNYWRENLKTAADELSWDNEKYKLLEIYKNINNNP